MSSIRVESVRGRKSWNDFFDLPWRLHASNPYWVPVPDFIRRAALDQKRNPFWRHSQMEAWIARRGNVVVGRICGIIDHHFCRPEYAAAATFGFFEAENDASASGSVSEITRALMDTLATWARAHGCRRVIGPFNPNMNSECGLLTEGFEDPPAIMMPYNPRYYVSHLEGNGFRPLKSFLAYTYQHDPKFDERIVRHAARLQERGSVHIRSIRRRDLQREISTIVGLMNDSMADHWGFIPLEIDEAKRLAEDLRWILDPELLLIAEVEGEPAGYLLALPDLHQAFARVRARRMTPVAAMRLLWALKGPFRRRTITRCRFIALGIAQRHASLALGPLLYAEILARFRRGGFATGEASWVLEDNLPVNRVHRRLGAQVTKRYMIYEKDL